MSLTFARVLQDFVENDAADELLTPLYAAYPLGMSGEDGVLKLKAKTAEKLLARLTADIAEVPEAAAVSRELAVSILYTQFVRSFVQWANARGADGVLLRTVRQSFVFKVVRLEGELLTSEALIGEFLVELPTSGADSASVARLAAVSKCRGEVLRRLSGLLAEGLAGQEGEAWRSGLQIWFESLPILTQVVNAGEGEDAAAATAIVANYMGLSG